jgi:FkbM family methyltransferase
MKVILFDLGANNGSRWFDILSSDQENTYVYMFEPTPQLCEVIKNKYKGLKNWTLIESAVSNYDGKALFNIAGHYDWGCSSLYNFRDDVNITWPIDRKDFHFTEKIEVDVITLNTFLLQNPEITHINYLHVDTQGSDLNVLKGCSNYLNYIKKGNIEAALEAPLYDKSPTKDECVKWLIQNEFIIDAINGGPHECDIFFHNKSL